MKTKFFPINQLRIVHVLLNPEDLNFIHTYQKQLAITLQRCSQELTVAQLIDAYCFTACITYFPDPDLFQVSWRAEQTSLLISADIGSYP